jgi:hypothetical protein
MRPWKVLTALVRPALSKPYRNITFTDWDDLRDEPGQDLNTKYRRSWLISASRAQDSLMAPRLSRNHSQTPKIPPPSPIHH